MHWSTTMADATCLLCLCTQQGSLLKPFIRFVLTCALEAQTEVCSRQEIRSNEAALCYLN